MNSKSVFSSIFAVATSGKRCHKASFSIMAVKGCIGSHRALLQLLDGLVLFVLDQKWIKGLEKACGEVFTGFDT